MEWVFVIGIVIFVTATLASMFTRDDEQMKQWRARYHELRAEGKTIDEASKLSGYYPMPNERQ